jgi:hypothetical protein
MAIIKRRASERKRSQSPRQAESAQMNSKSQFRPSAFGFVRVARIAALKAVRKA